MAAPPTRFHPGGAESAAWVRHRTRRTAEGVAPGCRLTASGAGHGALAVRV